MKNIEVKSVYELLGEKINAEFNTYRKCFIAQVKNGVLHDTDCFSFTIKSDLNEYFYSDDVEGRITEKQAEELLEIENVLDELAEVYREFERDWQEPIEYAVKELAGGRD